MATLIVNQKGALVRIGNKTIRSPFKAHIKEGTQRIVRQQLSLQGITDFLFQYPDKKKMSVNKNHRYVLNYRKDPVDERDRKVGEVEEKTLKAFRSSNEIIDYTSQMSPVKDQMMLGSCTGFAIVAMKEWQEQQEHLREILEGKRYRRKEKHYDLSEQWLYYKAKEIDEWPGEEGTSIRFGMKVLNKIGVPCEKGWPYDDIYVGEPKRWANMVSLWSLGGEYRSIESMGGLIESLRNNGPLPIGIECFEEIFYVGRDGVVSYPAEPDWWYGGHAICLVGWNPTKNLFKFKNSWGREWGQFGYGYLPYNYIRDFCMDAWEIKDLSVTKDMLRK